MLTAKITSYNNDGTYTADLIGGSVVLTISAIFTDRDLDHMGNSVEFSMHAKGQHAKHIHRMYLNEKYTLKLGNIERQKEIKNMLFSLENMTSTIRDELDPFNSTYESKTFDMVTDLLVYQERFAK